MLRNFNFISWNQAPGEEKLIPIDVTPPSPDPLELVRRGKAQYERGEWQPALEYLEQALVACRQSDMADRRAEAEALNLLGGLYYYRAGRQPEAAVCYQQALEISRQLADKWGETKALFNLAGIYQAQARYPEAKDLLDRLIALDRELGSPELRSHLIVLGAVRKRLKRLGLVKG
jgi:tetratricopeptide (TPR) repeat protein